LCFYILQRSFPHFVGRLVTYPKEGAIVNQAISGYNLWITFEGTLRGNIVPNYRNIIDEINEAFFDMAAWFYTEKIILDKQTYQKYKINDTSSVQ
jgi:hypothetical protein